MVLRAVLIFALMTAFISQPLLTISAAEQCDGQTCIDVSADDENHVTISIRKGRPGASATTSPRPRPSATRKPVWIPWLPKPVVTATKVSRPRTTRMPKPAPKPRVKRIASSSLAEQVKRMLPGGVIVHQPLAGILVREPVNFMTSVPSTFQTVIVALNVPIHIQMRATYLWDFGDGERKITTTPGAAYPLGEIGHTFSNPGEYKVGLQVRWSGTFRAGAIAAPITGGITQRFERDVTIYPANTRLAR